MAVRRQLIRRRAEELIDKVGATEAPIPVDRIAKALGISVAFVPAEEELSGFLVRRPGPEGNVIGVNRNDAPVRRRFTIAHELGHFCLHVGEEVHVDRSQSVFLRGPLSSKGLDEREVEANLFAAELLMPARMLEPELKAGEIDVGDEDQVKSLARRYQVSSQAMTIRLVNLGG